MNWENIIGLVASVLGIISFAKNDAGIFFPFKKNFFQYFLTQNFYCVKTISLSVSFHNYSVIEPVTHI